MAALNDLSDLINRATGGNSGTPESLWFFKSARVVGGGPPASIAGRPQSLWVFDGQPGAGTTPSTPVVPTNTTAGGLQQVNPTGGRSKWLIQAAASGLVAGTLVLYDRILHNGGLSGTVTTAQTVQGTGTPTPALTRYTNGIGNIAFAEIYTQIGATATTITASYLNESAATQSTLATAFGGTGFRELSRIVFLPLAAGDRGITVLRTVTVLATTATAGNFGVTVGHPLAYMNIGLPGGAGWRDFATGLPGIPEILTDACLGLLWVPNTVTAPEIFGCISMVEA